MKQNNTLAYLRQLCCSGLNKESVIPEFLRAVQMLVPSYNNTFSGINEFAEPSYFMFDFPNDDRDSPAILVSYFDDQRKMSLFKWFQSNSVLVDTSVVDESFYSSDLYNLVFRRYDQHHVIFALVKSADKIAGILSICRPRQQKPFNKTEQVLISHLLPYLAHALQVPDRPIVEYCELGSTGMMLFSPQGQKLYQCSSAEKLMVLACTPLVSIVDSRKEIELHRQLGQLCRNLQGVFLGLASPPPVWSFIGLNGRFKFQAYWLNAENGEAGGMIGMTIEHQEPIVLKILRGLSHFPLSPTQQEVALLLAQGYRSEAIGERLHIKLSTVKDHIGKIFTKLDLHHRDELLPKLLAFDN